MSESAGVSRPARGQAAYAAGETAQYTDGLTGISGRVVVDEVIDDSGMLLTSTVRYAVRYEGGDEVFVTDATRLRKASAAVEAVAGPAGDAAVADLRGRAAEAPGSPPPMRRSGALPGDAGALSRVTAVLTGHGGRGSARPANDGNPDDVTCPECRTEDWDFFSAGRARCANAHEWSQAPALPGTFVRPGFLGDVNDPERYPDEREEPEGYDPGPEIDDQGGMSERRPGLPGHPF